MLLIFALALLTTNMAPPATALAAWVSSTQPKLCGVLLAPPFVAIQRRVEQRYAHSIECKEVQSADRGEASLNDNIPTITIRSTEPPDARKAVVIHELMHMQLWLEGILPLGIPITVPNSAKFPTQYVRTVVSAWADAIEHTIISSRLQKLGISEYDMRLRDLTDTMAEYDRRMQPQNVRRERPDIPVSAVMLMELRRYLGIRAQPLEDTYVKYGFGKAIELAGKLDAVIRRDRPNSPKSADKTLTDGLHVIFESPEDYTHH